MINSDVLISPLISELITDSRPEADDLEFWTPLSETITAWFDAQDSNSITVTGSGVSTWADKSGNSNDASQGTDASRPPNGGTINGFNALTFDGSNDNLTTSLTQLTTASIYAVLDANTKGAAKNNVYLHASTAFNAGGVFCSVQNTSDGSAKHSVFYTSSQDIYTNGVLNETDHGFNPCILSHSISGGSTESLSYTISRADAYNCFSGVIGEILIFPEVHSTQTRQRVEGYLAAKWNLQSILSATHPYRYAAPTL